MEIQYCEKCKNEIYHNAQGDCLTCGKKNKEKRLLKEIINRLPDKEIEPVRRFLLKIWRKYHPLNELRK